MSEAYFETAIVTISADDSFEQIAECLTNGAIIDYLIKPLVRKEVQALPRYIKLHQYRLQRARAAARYIESGVQGQGVEDGLFVLSDLATALSDD